jgi:hypothetical protein
MDELPAAALLEAWEDGLARPAAERPLALLHATGAVDPSEDPARLPLGQRDSRLLALHATLFGPRLDCAVRCPACNEELEVSMQVEDLRLAGRSDAAPPPVAADGYEVSFRLPGAEDLARVAAVAETERRRGTEASEVEAAARRRLFERCVVAAQRDGEPVDPGSLPATVVAAVSEAMGRADPQAGLRVALECPECGHGWESPFDAAPFLWQQTDRWARSTLLQVHTLASAYGWSEREILALGAGRRRAYLDLLGA